MALHQFMVLPLITGFDFVFHRFMELLHWLIVRCLFIILLVIVAQLFTELLFLLQLLEILVLLKVVFIVG
jgi:hypothetical protein